VKRRLINLLIAHAVGSYAVYLLEDIRRYMSHIPIEPLWTILAPVFAPIALIRITFFDQYRHLHPAGMIFRLWMAYCGSRCRRLFCTYGLFTTKKGRRWELSNMRIRSTGDS